MPVKKSNNNMEGTPPPTGASPTQPYKCSQNVKIKTALNEASDREGRPYGMWR